MGILDHNAEKISNITSPAHSEIYPKLTVEFGPELQISNKFLEGYAVEIIRDIQNQKGDFSFLPFCTRR